MINIEGKQIKLQIWDTVSEAFYVSSICYDGGVGMLWNLISTSCMCVCVNGMLCNLNVISFLLVSFIYVGLHSNLMS